MSTENTQAYKTSDRYVSQKGNGEYGVSDESRYLTYVSKKTEKLMTAVYMLTDFLSDTEPMKRRLRELGLSILSDIHSLSHLVLSDRKNAARRALDGIESILSFLEIASSTELISRMNTDVLRGEFVSLQDVLRARIFSPRENLGFTREFFAIQAPLPPEELSEKTSPVPASVRNFHTSSQRISGGILDQKMAEPPQASEASDPVLNTQHLDPLARQKKKDEIFSRKESILRIVKDMGEVTIGDVLSRLPGVGEKTVQRELVALVQGGMLKRTGERRWSKYSLP